MTSNPISDLLFQWMIERIAGTINEPDEQALDHLIETNPAIKKIWMNVQERFSKEDRANQLARFGEEDYWADVQNRNPLPWRKPKILSTRKALQAAAIAAWLILGSYYLAIRTYRHEASTLADVPKMADPQHSIQLRLAGGDTINLSTAKNEVTVGNVTLQSTAKSLSYGANDDRTASMASMNTLKVPFGMDYKVVLSDGTEIWLNSSTELRFPFSFTSNTREISVNGEAYLKVAKNTKQPFIVHTPSSSVYVLGTRFNVNTYDSAMIRVSLLEGAININNGDKQQLIRSGEEAVYQSEKGDIDVQTFDETTVLSWIEGIHYFRNAPLTEICEIFPRWFGIEIKLDNPAMGGKRFNGVLDRKKTALHFISALRDADVLDYYSIDQDGNFHIK